MAKKSLRGALERHELRKTQEERLKARDKHQEAVELAKKKKPALSHWWNPHTPGSLCILLGEADFGFAKAGLEENYLDEVIATNYDSEEEILAKYPGAAENIDFLRTDARVAALHFGVDATALNKHKKLWADIKKWKIENPEQSIEFVFNFPHLGASIKDQDRNIRAHQSLIQEFFKQVMPLNARVIITLFDGEPYDSWQIKALARTQGLRLERSGMFNWAKYPGYAHCLTAKQGKTSKTQHERKARVFAFVKKEEKPENPQK